MTAKHTPKKHPRHIAKWWLLFALILTLGIGGVLIFHERPKTITYPKTSPAYYKAQGYVQVERYRVVSPDPKVLFDKKTKWPLPKPLELPNWNDQKGAWEITESTIKIYTPDDEDITIANIHKNEAGKIVATFTFNAPEGDLFEKYLVYLT